MKRVLMLVAAGLFVSGCASPDVNPPQARVNTGYVDFHADSSEELSWQVRRFDDRTGSFQHVSSELKPPQDGFLRLAFEPGAYRLQVTFLNRVTVKPVEVEVEVQDGKISPVRVTLTAAGVSLVRTREENVGSAGSRRYGRHAKIGAEETARYDVSAVVESPVAYQLKGRMPYAH